jgi:hypothetical protein
MKKILNRDSPGFVLVEHMGAILIAFVLMPVLAGIIDRGMTALRNRSVAAHFTTIAKAAELYAEQHHSTLFAASTANTGTSVTLAALRTAGVLASNVRDTNAWGQSYSIVSRKRDGDLTMIILTTGGRTHTASSPQFGNVTVPETAALAKAGYVPVSPATVLRGAGGAWQASLSDMGISGTAGHLGLVTSLDSSLLENDFLYRVAVPGHPEFNQMSISLDMTNHDINGVRTLQYTPHTLAEMEGGTFCTSPDDEGKTFLDATQGLYLCRDGRTVMVSDSGNSLMMQSAQLVVDSQLLNKPACADGTGLHPEIYVMPAIAASGAESPTMAAFQAWATDYTATQWQVHLRIKNASNNWIYPTADYGRMIAFATCARD